MKLKPYVYHYCSEIQIGSQTTSIDGIVRTGRQILTQARYRDIKKLILKDSGLSVHPEKLRIISLTKLR